MAPSWRSQSGFQGQSPLAGDPRGQRPLGLGPKRHTLHRLVLGLGNPVRGDDGIGRMVVRALRGLVPGDVRIEELDGEATAILALLREAKRVWLIDAAWSGAVAGTIRRLDCAAGDLPPARPALSSHGFGPAEAIGLARALGCLPAGCVVYAIEGARFTVGTAPSRRVAAAGRVVAQRVLDELTGTGMN